MKLAFLLDQGLPRSACLTLRQSGFIAIHVAELAMSAASDEQILSFARNNGYVVVTLDADFHQLLALRNAVLPSVVRIRREGLKGPELASIIRALSDRASGELVVGSAVTVDALGARIRRLPIRP